MGNKTETTKKHERDRDRRFFVAEQRDRVPPGVTQDFPAGGAWIRCDPGSNFTPPEVFSMEHTGYRAACFFSG